MHHFGYQSSSDYYAPLANSIAPVPPPPPPSHMFNQNPVADNGNVAYGNWMRPGGHQNPHANIGRTFPQKTIFSQDLANGKRKWSNVPKKTPSNAEPQTPAALLNQHFKNIDERYKEVARSSFQCTLLVNGQEFSMEANTKKHAKQRTAELVLRSLRPDLEFASFENGVEIKPLITSLEVPTPTPNQAPVVVEPSTKRVKSEALSAADSAVSIQDFLRRKCIEKREDGPFNTKFIQTEVSTESESSNNMQPNKLFKCSLSFPEQGLFFVKEYITQAGAKDLACIQALTDIFKVTSEELRNIARRSLLCKSLKKQQGSNSSVSTLHHVGLISMCDIKFDVSVALVVGKDKGIGTGSMRYECLLTVTDHAKDNQQVTFTSPPMISKQAAKEYAASEILRSYFLIDTADAGTEKTDDVSPISQLYNLLVKYKRNEKPNFQEVDSSMSSSVDSRFTCKVTVGTREYFASGPSKKAAKQAAAATALEDMFSCTTSPTPNGNDIKKEYDESVDESTSNLCMEIVTFTKDAYFKMCTHLNLKKGTSVAGICLLNDKNEKRVVSLANSQPHVVRLGGVVTSQGTSIVHMDPIVLARRSFNRYLLSEIEKARSDPTSCIVMRAEDGKWKLKPTIRVVIFSSRPPSLISNQSDSRKLLTTVAFDSTIEAVPDHVLCAQEISNDDYLRVHTAADKIFKWTQLGMQGGLLSNILHPVIPYGVMFASQSSHSHEDLRLALADRLGTNQSEVLIDYINQPLREIPAEPVVYTKDLGHEQLGLQTGRTITGASSRYSKSALFESFKKLKDLPRETSYAEAKNLAVEYSTKKKELYDKLNEAGFGHWQQKPSTLLDFSAVVFD